MGTPDIISVETTERLRGPTYSAQRRENREPHGAGQDRVAPADAVGNGAGEHRADQHAGEREAAEQARARLGQAPAGFHEQLREHGAVDNEVVTVEDDDHPAEGGHE